MTVLATPALAAGDESPEPAWRVGPGKAEPNTGYDTREYMWDEPNADGVDKIYFNGFFSPLHIAGIATEPEFDGGATMTSFAYIGNAYLGYWRDCNADDYIGNKNTPSNYGNWGSYPVDIANLEDGVCPESTYYNTGSWVNEWLPVGPEGSAGRPYEEDRECEPKDDAVNTTFACYGATIDQFYLRSSPNVVEDAEAKVWFDFGAPDAQASEVRNIQERGWMQDSNGTLRWTDFWTGRTIETISEEGLTVDEPVTGETISVPATGVWGDKPNIGGCERDEEGHRTLGSGDTNTCGLWPLYQVKRLYNDSDSESEGASPLVTAFDESSSCGENGVPVTDDTTLYHRDVSPGVHPAPLTEGSIGGTVVHIQESVQNYNESSGECENEYTPGQGVADDNLETHADRGGGKTRSESAMFYVSEWRTRALEAAEYDDAPLNAFNAKRGGFWTTEYVYFTVPPTAGTFTIARPTASFYADLSDAAIDGHPENPGVDTAIPSGTLKTGEYGENQCQGSYDSGEVSHGGWLCDTSAWETQLEKDERQRGRYAIIGEAFTLRDVDCYDGTLFRESVAGEELAPRASLLAVTEAANDVTGLDTLPQSNCESFGPDA